MTRLRLLIFSFIYRIILKFFIKTIFSYSIKALEIKSSMAFDLVFANNSILSYFFLSFLIPAVVVEIFNLTVELAIPARIPTKEAKSEIKTNLVFVKAKLIKCSIYFKIGKTLFLFLLNISFLFICFFRVHNIISLPRHEQSLNKHTCS